MSERGGWFKHQIDAVSDEKIDGLIAETGAAGYGVFWRVTEILYRDGKANKSKLCVCLAKRLLLSEAEFLAILDVCIRLGIWECDEFDPETIFSTRVSDNRFKLRKEQEELSQKRSEAGKLGGRPKANESKRKQSEAKRLDQTRLDKSKNYLSIGGSVVGQLTLTDTDIAALVMNHCDGDENIFLRERALAEDYLSANGKAIRDGAAYMRSWLTRAKLHGWDRPQLHQVRKPGKLTGQSKFDAQMKELAKL